MPVAGTDHHATAQVPCGFDGAVPTNRRPAGVKREWAEADGSADWNFKVSRRDD